AQLLYPATILTLILSDVVGDRIEDIGSGLTAPDPTTYTDARRVLEKYRAWAKIPRPAQTIIARGVLGKIGETPKPGSQVFRRVFNVIVGGNSTACRASAEALRRKGFRPLILTTRLQGEAKEAGRFLSAITTEAVPRPFTLKPPIALVMGGETSVTVRG